MQGSFFDDFEEDFVPSSHTLTTLQINGSDNLNFQLLLKRYADYQKLAEKPLPDTSTEYLRRVFQDYITEDSETLEEAVTLSLREIFALKIYQELLPRVALSSVEEKQNIARETIEEIVHHRALKTLLNLFYCHRLLDQDSTTIGLDLALIAMRLREHLETFKDPTVLFLGRSPDLVKKFLLADYDLYPTSGSTKPKIIHVAFSGTPDIENIRSSAYYAHPSNKSRIIARNMVTDPKLLFFMHYLALLGLNQVAGPLVIVDMISTGSSMNAFLKLLYYFYQDFLEQPLPKINIAFLHPESPPTKMDECVELPYSYNYQNNSLHFQGVKQLGLCDMDVPGLFFQTSATVIELLLDYPHFQTLVADVPEFPAQQWTKEGSYALLKGGYFHKETYAGIKSEIATYVRQAHQEFQQFALRRLLKKTRHNP